MGDVFEVIYCQYKMKQIDSLLCESTNSDWFTEISQLSNFNRVLSSSMRLSFNQSKRAQN